MPRALFTDFPILIRKQALLSGKKTDNYAMEDFILNILEGA